MKRLLKCWNALPLAIVIIWLGLFINYLRHHLWWYWYVLLLMVLPLASSAQTPFLVKNGWTNTILFAYVDNSGNNVAIACPVGGSVTGSANGHSSATGFSVTDVSNPVLTVNVLGDGTTNELVVQVSCSPDGSGGYNLIESQFQYAGAFNDFGDAAGTITIRPDPNMLNFFWAGFSMTFAWYCGFGLVKRIVTKSVDHSPNL